MFSFLNQQQSSSLHQKDSSSRLKVIIPDAVPKAFEMVLSYIYTDRIHPTQKGERLSFFCSHLFIIIIFIFFIFHFVYTFIFIFHFLLFSIIPELQASLSLVFIYDFVYDLYCICFPMYFLFYLIIFNTEESEMFIKLSHTIQ